MSKLQTGQGIDRRVPWIHQLLTLNEARGTGTPAARERAVQQAGRKLGDALRSGPKVVSLRTLPTSAAPYPVRFAFNGTVRAVAPGAMLSLQNRSLLVQVQTTEGVKNVLFNPTDGPANAATPFYQRVSDEVPELIRRFMMPNPNRCAQQLAALGLSCADIDVIAFDHFHTQDLRPLLGTAQLSARFPNAVLLAPRAEWEDWDDLSMLQRAWFVPDGKRDVPGSRVVLTQGDLTLGDGLLLVSTPGHTRGNQTLIVHTERGVVGSSENGTCADNWAPEASRIAGVKRAARLLDLAVVLNSNTPELMAEQYVSMLLERAIVDRVPENPEFYQMFPSSEVTRSWLAPLLVPSHSFGSLQSGQVQRSSQPGALQSAEVQA